MNGEDDPLNNAINQDEYMRFITVLKEKESSEIEEIILHYSSYRQEMAEAALYVAVDRGMIRYELKEKITDQIRFIFSGKAEAAKRLRWEKDNAFTLYFSEFPDEKIYELIDNPSGIVLDVYHGMLTAALGRELISADDFAEYFGNALKGIELDKETWWERRQKRFDFLFENDEPVTGEQIKARASQYWKCQNCGELVDKELNACWKCESPAPDKPVPPSEAEIIREIRSERSSSSHLREGSLMLLGGILIMIWEWLRTFIYTGRKFNPVFFGLGALFALLGLGIVIFRLTSRKKE